MKRKLTEKLESPEITEMRERTEMESKNKMSGIDNDHKPEIKNIRALEEN